MSDPKPSFPPLEEQLTRIKRGVVDLVTEEDLRRRLARSLEEGRPLRVKLGIDPSSPDIHVGHTVQLRKLRTFQECGHQAVIIWGTATAMVGDPTGKDKTRPQLSREQVLENLRTYREQIGKVVDVDLAEHHENGAWFDRFTFQDTIRLMSRMTVARVIERDSFQNRMSKGLPIGLHEIIYPLMQGWDSVEIRADIELGGTDQLFNLLAGRDLQQQVGQEPQLCLTMPILEGLDGVQKMSKSLGNTIGLNDDPVDMFGKVMSIPDSLMEKYFLLLTEVEEADLRELLAGHPREAKAELARRVTAWLHGAEASERAAREFDRVFRERERPTEIPEFEVPADALKEGRIQVAVAAHLAGLGSSGGEIRRAIKGGGVRVDGERIADPTHALGSGSYLLQVGKRRFVRLRIP